MILDTRDTEGVGPLLPRSQEARRWVQGNSPLQGGHAHLLRLLLLLRGEGERERDRDWLQDVDLDE